MVSLLPAHLMAVVCGVLFVLVFISAYNGLVFTFDEQGNFIDGPWGFIVPLFDFMAYLFEIALIFRCHRFLSLGEMLSLSGFGILPVVSVSMGCIWYPVPEYLTATLTMMVIFTFFHKEISKQFVEKEKELVQKELELSKSRISILMSQIEPHFLFNSLSTIKHLCRKEPKEAIEAIDKFSNFLRGSMDALTEEKRITFEREMEFVDSYLYLERKRFGDRLKIQYDIRAKGFLVPALSIQILAENAVRHGITKKLTGGVVTIATWEDEENFMVSITDDGIGFEMEEVYADGKNHIGIHNVRSRLSMMCGGILEIQSTSGEGTKVVCILPKARKEKKKNNQGRVERCHEDFDCG